LGDLVLDACSLRIVESTAQIPLSISQAIQQHLLGSFSRSQPLEVLPQPRQRLVKVTGEVNILAASQPKWHFNI
jgi:hypothetical protein